MDNSVRFSADGQAPDFGSVGEARSPAQILIAADDAPVVTPVVEHLTLEGFDVRSVASMRDMCRAFESAEPDAIILDALLPDDTGWNALRWLRSRSEVPIIIVTGKRALVDKVVGLELGADDYLTKPFELPELLARVHTMLRRVHRRNLHAKSTLPASVKFAEWTLNFATQQLTRDDGDSIHLTQAEYRMLTLLARNPNRVITRDQLMNCLGGRGWQPLDRSVDIRISKLRNKIDRDPRLPSLIRTVRGSGYMFVPDREEPVRR